MSIPDSICSTRAVGVAMVSVRTIIGFLYYNVELSRKRLLFNSLPTCSHVQSGQ